MPRPKKDPDQKVRPREISATDAQWLAVKKAAGEADMTISRYLLSTRSGAVAAPARELRLLLALDDALGELEATAGMIPANLPGATLLLTLISRIEVVLQNIRLRRPE